MAFFGILSYGSEMYCAGYVWNFHGRALYKKDTVGRLLSGALMHSHFCLIGMQGRVKCIFFFV